MRKKSTARQALTKRLQLVRLKKKLKKLEQMAQTKEILPNEP